MDRSRENTIIANHFFDNYRGVCLGLDAKVNKVIGNTISDNYEGIFFWHSSDNRVYWNNLLHQHDRIVINPSQAMSQWDNGSEGNYWSDHSGWDGNGDGISDIPYRIKGGGIDHYPLMRPWKPSVVAMGIKFTGPDEFVTVRNWSEEDVDLTGWQLQSVDLETKEVEHTFSFPADCILPADGKLRVHSGSASVGKENEPCGAPEFNLYRGWLDLEEGASVWGDLGGIIRLIDDQGEVVDEYEYGWWMGG